MKERCTLNAISVLGTAAEQQRIGNAINDLDAAQGSGQGSGGGADCGDGNIAVVSLPYAITTTSGGPSTSVQDIASAVQQALAGSPQSIRLVKEMVAKLDAPQPLVVLDTEVLEVDECS